MFLNILLLFHPSLKLTLQLFIKKKLTNCVARDENMIIIKNDKRNESE